MVGTSYTNTHISLCIDRRGVSYIFRSRSTRNPTTQSMPRKVGTTPYLDANGGSPKFFRAVVFLNTFQSAISTFSALGYLIARWPRDHSLTQLLGLSTMTSSDALTHQHTTQEESKRQERQEKIVARHHSPLAFLWNILQCALLHSLSSPFSFASLRHIDYPTMILGKSCKLVPVMIMNILLYRRRFAPHKYLVVALVSVGIAVFTLYQPQKASKSGSVKSNSAFGLGLLLVSLAIDGATNSTQDEIFARYKISGPQMMFFMNAFATIITLLSLVVPIPALPVFGIHGNRAGEELSTAMAFIRSHPSVLTDIVGYSIAGALGQLFIFDTLEHFGSLTLVTITVTRKLFTMLLSVAVYKHKLAGMQWVGVATVFLAIGLEALQKRRGGISKKVLVSEKESAKARLKQI